MSNLGDARHIHHFEAGIAQCLAEHESRVGPDGGGKSVWVSRIDKTGLNAEAR